MVFKPAIRKDLKIRLALLGPTGSGKTYTALGVATSMAEGGRIAVIDTERSSADRYADRFAFDTNPLTAFSPEAYMGAIEEAATAGYPVLVIDSLSHAWDGVEGLLERVDAIAKRKGGNSFNAWGDATPLHRRLIDTILAYPGHVVVTMRSKMEYVQEKDERTGKTVIRKVGLAPVQRQGVEYEFDLVGEMDQEHILVITKSRAADLADKVINRPGKAFAAELLKWAKGGAPAEPKPAGEPEPKTHEPARRNDPSLRRETKPDPKPSTETPKPPPLPKTKPAVEPKTERAEPVPVAKPAEPPTDVTPTPAQVTEPPKIAKLPVAQRNAAIRDIFSRSARAGENAGQMKETIGKLIGLGRPINGSHEIPDAAIPHVISHYDKSNGSGVQS